MRPDFGEDSHTSCLCFNKTAYPYELCGFIANKETLTYWQGKVTQIERVIAVTTKPYANISSSAHLSSVLGHLSHWHFIALSFVIILLFLLGIGLYYGESITRKLNWIKAENRRDVQGQVPNENLSNEINSSFL